MACSGCGGGQALPGEMKMTQSIKGPLDNPQSGLVRLEYIGQMFGNATYTGRVTGEDYYAGNNSTGKYIDVDPADAPGLVALGLFRVIDLSHLKKDQAEQVVDQVNAASGTAQLTPEAAKLAAEEAARLQAAAALEGLGPDGLLPPEEAQVSEEEDGLPAPKKAGKKSNA